jgi:probable DNA metabolism protein
MLQHTVMLDGETDWLGFRREARAFLAHLVPPECISWHARPDTPAELAADTGMPTAHADSAGAGSMNPVVPRSFMTLCETVVLHDDPNRFGLLYRLLWRLVHEPDLRRDPLDADRMRAQHMAQAVRRDMQKMKACVRFRALDDGEAADPLRAAWFEPAHHIVEAVAPFFVRRFAQTRWAVLTPERSMRWNGETLEFGPGGRRDQAPLEDDGEASWLACYHRIFSASQRSLATRTVVPAEH